MIGNDAIGNDAIGDDAIGDDAIGDDAIGNDIVDLGDEDSVVRRHHERFDSRVFAAEELQRLDASDDPELLRWSMWAAKEAAYKLLKASRPSVVFSPPHFVVRPAGHNAATVEIAGIADVEHVRVRVDFQTTPVYVHAIARTVCSDLRTQGHDFEVASHAATAAAVATHADDGMPVGDAARQLAVTSVARVLGEEPAALSVGRDGRVPVLLRAGKRVAGSLSLSHHGRFVAFAWSAAVR